MIFWTVKKCCVFCINFQKFYLHRKLIVWFSTIFAWKVVYLVPNDAVNRFKNWGFSPIFVCPVRLRLGTYIAIVSMRICFPINLKFSCWTFWTSGVLSKWQESFSQWFSPVNGSLCVIFLSASCSRMCTCAEEEPLERGPAAAGCVERGIGGKEWSDGWPRMC